jgi:hypothetical protein
MGQSTLSAIVSHGLKLAAREDLAEAGPDGVITPYLELQMWLRKIAADWPWPQLWRRATGISVPAGTVSLNLGAGATVTNAIQRILDPCILYDAQYRARATVRVQRIEDNGVQFDETVNDPTTTRGQPQYLKVRPFDFTTSITAGKWTVYFSPVPDRAYLLALPYMLMPADPGAAEYPWYPVDRTMVHMVKTFAFSMGHDQEKAAMANEELGAMIARDKMDHGQNAGININTALDSNVFRQPSSSSWRGSGWWPQP